MDVGGARNNTGGFGTRLEIVKQSVSYLVLHPSGWSVLDDRPRGAMIRAC